VQYCHGTLTAQWDRYVRRILATAHARGRVTDDEYASYSTQPFVFDRKEATFTEKQCLEWVKNMAPPKREPEPDAPPDVDDADGGADAAGWPPKRLRKLFSHGTLHHAPATPPPAPGKSIAVRTQAH
jgi:hypothetical protein